MRSRFPQPDDLPDAQRVTLACLKSLVVEDGPVAARVLDPPGVVLEKNPRVTPGNDFALGPLDDKPARGIAAEHGFDVRDRLCLFGFEVLKNDAGHDVGYDGVPGTERQEDGTSPA